MSQSTPIKTEKKRVLTRSGSKRPVAEMSSEATTNITSEQRQGRELEGRAYIAQARRLARNQLTPHDVPTESIEVVASNRPFRQPAEAEAAEASSSVNENRPMEQSTEAMSQEPDLDLSGGGGGESEMLNPVVDSDLQQQQQQEPSNRNSSSSSSDIPILPFASDRMNRSPSPVPRQSGQESNPFGIQSGIVPQRTRMLFGPPGSPNVAQLPPARGLDELKALQQQLQQINSTLEATKTSDAACQKALKEAKDALEACRKALEASNIPDQFVQDLAKTKAQLKKVMELNEEKDKLINKHTKVSESIAEERANHQKAIEEYKESLKTEREKSANLAKEISEGFEDFQKADAKLKKQDKKIRSLKDDLDVATEEKKTLTKELEAERKRKPDVNKEDLFWELFLDPGFPKSQWQSLRHALRPDTNNITEKEIKARLDAMKASQHLLDSKEVSDLKVQLRDVQDELERIKKEKEDLSKAVVPMQLSSSSEQKALILYRSPSPSADMKDVQQPQSMALVARPSPRRNLSDCEEDLAQEKAKRLQAETNLTDRVREYKAKIQALKGDISELNTRLFVANKATQDLKNSMSSNPLGDDVKEEEDEDEGDCKEELRKCKEGFDAANANVRKAVQFNQNLKAGETKLLAKIEQYKNELATEKKERAEEKAAYNELKARVEAVEVGVSLEDLAPQARAGATCEAKLQRALEEIKKLKETLIDEKASRDLQDAFASATGERDDAKADANRFKRELKQCAEELTNCRKDLEDCEGELDWCKFSRNNHKNLWVDQLARSREMRQMVRFMDSMIQNLTERAAEKDQKQLNLETDKLIAEAKAAMVQAGLNDLAIRFERLAAQLRTCHNDRIRLEETLRRAERERDEAKRGEASAKNLKMTSVRQSKEQILADANKKLNKTACNFIEDSLEFLIGGATGYINTGLPQRSEKKEAAMFYIHALCAEPHWAFLVARYLGKDYTMAYPLSEQIQLVLLDENETYEPESRSGRIHRSRDGWFTSSRRAKVIRVFDAFIVDMHYHRGMRQLRDIHRRPKDTMGSKDPGSFQLPDAAWVLKRVRFWNNEDEKPMYSGEDRMAITKEIIRAYQLFDLFDLDTSVPPVEIGWKAFMTDGDTQPDIAVFVTHLVHKRSYGHAGHELIWGTIRDNPSLLRYWRYEYPEPLVLLLPLWNYIMYVLNSNYNGPQLKTRIDKIGGSRDLLTRIQTYLPKVKEVHEQSVERMAQQRRRG